MAFASISPSMQWLTLNNGRDTMCVDKTVRKETRGVGIFFRISRGIMWQVWSGWSETSWAFGTSQKMACPISSAVAILSEIGFIPSFCSPSLISWSSTACLLSMAIPGLEHRSDVPRLVDDAEYLDAALGGTVEDGIASSGKASQFRG